jgi:hypothetical protein
MQTNSSTDLTNDLNPESTLNFPNDNGKFKENLIDSYKDGLWNEVLFKEIDNIHQRLKTQTKKLKSLKNNQKKVVKDFKDDLDKQRFDSIEILAIFTSLFTFISVEFQIFRSFESWQAGASLSLILIGGLTLFIWMFNFFFGNKKTVWFIILSMLLMLSGIVFLGLSKLKYNGYQMIEVEKLRQDMEELKYNSNTLTCLKNSGYFKLKCFDKN